MPSETFWRSGPTSRLVLATNPLAGRARPELGTALRSLPVGSYVIFCRADDEAIDVLRVRSGYLDIDPDDFT